MFSQESMVLLESWWDKMLNIDPIIDQNPLLEMKLSKHLNFKLVLFYMSGKAGRLPLSTVHTGEHEVKNATMAFNSNLKRKDYH